MTSSVENLKALKCEKAEVQIKNCVESMHSRCKQCEDRMLKLEDRANVSDYLLRYLENSKRTWKWIEWLLDGTKKTNVRLNGINENQETALMT